MIIPMSKFGTLLNGRPAAKEVALRIQQMVNGSGKKKGVVLDFSGVEVLTPGFADELLRILRKKYGSEEVMTRNASKPVAETLKFLKKTNP